MAIEYVFILQIVGLFDDLIAQYTAVLSGICLVNAASAGGYISEAILTVAGCPGTPPCNNHGQCVQGNIASQSTSVILCKMNQSEITT